MADFLTRLAERATGAIPVVQPVIPPAFAPVAEPQEIHREVPPAEPPATFSDNLPLAQASAPPHPTALSHPPVPYQTDQPDRPHSPVARHEPVPREPRNTTPHSAATAPAHTAEPADTGQPSVMQPVSGKAPAALHTSDAQSNRKEESEQPAATEQRPITWSDAVEQRIAARRERQAEIPGTTNAAPVERRDTQPEPAAISLGIASRRDRESSPAPVINVSIGRIEVRAVMQPPPASKPAPRPGSNARGTLEEYLNNGSGRKR